MIVERIKGDTVVEDKRKLRQKVKLVKEDKSRGNSVFNKGIC